MTRFVGTSKALATACSPTAQAPQAPHPVSLRGAPASFRCSHSYPNSSSVVVHDFHVIRSVVFPAEAYPPPPVDPNAVLARSVAGEGLQPVTGQCSQIFQGRCVVQYREPTRRRIREVMKDGDRVSPATTAVVCEASKGSVVEPWTPAGSECQILNSGPGTSPVPSSASTAKRSITRWDEKKLGSAHPAERSHARPEPQRSPQSVETCGTRGVRGRDAPRRPGSGPRQPQLGRNLPGLKGEPRKRHLRGAPVPSL